VFLSHNLGSRSARKSNRGSKDADDSLDSKTSFIKKIGSLAWRPGPDKIRQKGKNAPLVMSLDRKRKKCFFNLNQKICWIRRAFEQLSSSLGWRVMDCYGIKTFGQKSGRYGSKRVKKPLENLRDLIGPPHAFKKSGRSTRIASV